MKKINSTIFILIMFSVQAFSQSTKSYCPNCQSVFIWDIITDDEEKNQFTDDLTYEIEEIIVNIGNKGCSVLNRRNYADLLDLVRSEYKIRGFDNINPSIKSKLDIIGAEKVVLGVLKRDGYLGTQTLNLSLTDLNTGQILGARSVKLKDPAWRRDSIRIQKIEEAVVEIIGECVSQQPDMTNELESSKIRKIYENKQLRVGFTYDAPMYYVVNGQEKGFAFELAQMIANKMGLKLKSEIVNYSDVEYLLTEDSIDMAMSGFIRDIRHGRNIRWTEDYMTADFCLIVDDGSGIKSINDLDNLAIGVYDEPFVKNWIRKNIPSARIVPFTEQDWFRYLDSARVDAIINDYPYSIESLKFHPEYNVIDYHVTPVGYSIAINRDNKGFRKLLNLNLRDIKETREYSLLYRKYINRRQGIPLIVNCNKEYTTLKEETLFDIAFREYGNKNKAYKIYDMNKNILTSQYILLKPGTTLCLPDD